jgi:hypothetical protein
MAGRVLGSLAGAWLPLIEIDPPEALPIELSN